MNRTPFLLTFRRELCTIDDVNRGMKVIIEADSFVCQMTPYLRRLAES